MTNGLLGDEPQKGFREGYVGPGTPPGPVGTLQTVPKKVGTHNVIEDRQQRPTTEVGGVYSFEAIAPTDPKNDGKPVVLRTELRLRADLVPSTSNWWTKFNGGVRLGVSKKDDYGEAQLNARKPEPCSTSVKVCDDGLFVWLLSDVLLRGNGLRAEPTVEALKQELEARLQVTLDIAEHDGLPSSFVRARRTESWHTGWGLPRPSLVGLQAGSCVKFAFGEGPRPDAATLAELEQTGLGERTAEGFGQVVFNRTLLTKRPCAWTAEDFGAAVPDDPRGDTGTPEPNADADETARHIERAAGREAIRTAVLAAAATPERRAAHFGWELTKPNMSQLGGLRSVMQFIRTEADSTRVLGWLDAVKANRKREGKWPNGALDKLTTLLTDVASTRLVAVPEFVRCGLGKGALAARGAGTTRRRDSGAQARRRTDRRGGAPWRVTPQPGSP
jgi:CRISPR-associated protein Csx10